MGCDDRDGVTELREQSPRTVIGKLARAAGIIWSGDLPRRDRDKIMASAMLRDIKPEGRELAGDVTNRRDPASGRWLNAVRSPRGPPQD